MLLEDKRRAIHNLQLLIKAISEAGLEAGRDWGLWAKNNRPLIDDLMETPPDLRGSPKKSKTGPQLEPMSSLFKPFFHPTLPLVGLNYTDLAHNTLHLVPQGWTTPLRFCRGIIFERTTGQLVALPFHKFFNLGDHPETQTLPDEPYEATLKYDGHLGIVFRYNGEILVTTRGSFTSPTSILAQEMLDQRVEKDGWQEHWPDGLTLMNEIIHPDTKVHVDYAGWQGFKLIGATNSLTLEDYSWQQLAEWSALFQLPRTELWTGSKLADLITQMKDRSVQNAEGYVVRFASGLRVKLKYETYIGLMVKSKLSYGYLMNRILSGNLEKMLKTLEEEVYNVALKMLGEIMIALNTPGSLQDKWRRLYTLPLDEKTRQSSYYQGICRKLVKTFLKETSAE